MHKVMIISLVNFTFLGSFNQFPHSLLSAPDTSLKMPLHSSEVYITDVIILSCLSLPTTYESNRRYFIYFVSESRKMTEFLFIESAQYIQYLFNQKLLVN